MAGCGVWVQKNCPLVFQGVQPARHYLTTSSESLGENVFPRTRAGDRQSRLGSFSRSREEWLARGGRLMNNVGARRYASGLQILALYS